MKHFIEVSHVISSLEKRTCDLCESEILLSSYEDRGSSSILINDLLEDENGSFGLTAEIDMYRECTHGRLVPLLKALFARDLPWKKVT